MSKRREARCMYFSNSAGELSNWRSVLKEAILSQRVSWIWVSRGRVDWSVLCLWCNHLVARKKRLCVSIIVVTNVSQVAHSWEMLFGVYRICGEALKYDDFGSWEGGLGGVWMAQVRHMGSWSDKLQLQRWKIFLMEWIHHLRLLRYIMSSQDCLMTPFMEQCQLNLAPFASCRMENARRRPNPVLRSYYLSSYVP